MSTPIPVRSGKTTTTEFHHPPNNNRVKKKTGAKGFHRVTFSEIHQRTGRVLGGAVWRENTLQPRRLLRLARVRLSQSSCSTQPTCTKSLSSLSRKSLSGSCLQRMSLLDKR